MFDSLTSHRLVALFVAGWLVFNFPLLPLWDREATVFGVPLFPISLFAVWALLIAAVAVIAERSPGTGGPGD